MRFPWTTSTRISPSYTITTKTIGVGEERKTLNPVSHNIVYQNGCHHFRHYSQRRVIEGKTERTMETRTSFADTTTESKKSIPEPRFQTWELKLSLALHGWLGHVSRGCGSWQGHNTKLYICIMTKSWSKRERVVPSKHPPLHIYWYALSAELPLKSRASKNAQQAPFSE